MQEEQSAKVTVAHLTRAERICARRLAQEHANGSGNRAGNSRWRVSNQVTADVRLVHTDLAAPRIGQFVPTDDLTPEQQAVYRLATRWYVTLFADRAVRVVDEDPWGTDLPGDVRLVGPAGLAFTDADDHAEIRLLSFGGRQGRTTELVDSPMVRFALLRRPDWLRGRTVRVGVADLVRGTYVETTIDTVAVLPGIEDWLAGRLDVIRGRIAAPTARRGLECAWCPFIAGCEAHRER
jgi:hypothetical protein